MLKRIFNLKQSLLALVGFSVLIVGLSSSVFAQTNLTAGSISADSIRLDWTSDTRVSLERKQEAGRFEPIARLDADCNTYLDCGLAEAKKYTYRLRPVLGWQYDFGPDAPPAEGSIRVRYSSAYSPEKGFGIVRDEIAEPGGDRDRGGNVERRLATLVYQNPKLTFVQDLPNGEYLISLASGDAQYEGLASVTLNGQEVAPLAKTMPGRFFVLDNRPVAISEGKLIVEIGGHGRMNYLTISPRSNEAPVLAETSAKTLSLLPSPGDTSYYVDASAGNDDRKGTSEQTAWKSLAKLGGVRFNAGDKILLKADCQFSGELRLHGSGVQGKPIFIDRYGQGANPILNGEGKVENTIRLHNQHHWQIRNLTVTNTDGGGWDDEGRKLRRAIYVTASDAGDVNHIYLQKLEIRDVRGMYRFEGNTTNGGVICQVLGDKQPTRFVDLRIEDCVFRTRSIDRYPVVVTTSWNKKHPGEIVYANNTLDHMGRAHTVIPADQWPRKLVYYFDPEAVAVFPLDRTAPPISPFTGRVGCEDVLSEMAARMKRSWSFFEDTRYEKGRWAFKFRPTSSDFSIWGQTMAMGYYGELRSFGFTPPWIDQEKEVLDACINEVLEYRDEKDNKLKGPVEGLPGMQEGIDKWGYVSFSFQWQLRNRVFLAGKYAAPPGAQISENFVRSKEAALELFNSLPWATRPYWAGNMIGEKAILNGREKLLAAGKEFPNEVVDMLHKMIDAKFNPDGYWGGEETSHHGRTNGNMKTMTTYWPLRWEIPHPKKIIDFTLSGANETEGFMGSGCTAFNQMYVLSAIRSKYPELRSYRSEEIDQYTALTFLTFLSHWNEKTNFLGVAWDAKHNNGVSLYMPHLLLDYPFMRGGTIYNWQHGPIIERDKNGRVKVNEAIHQTEGYLFDLSIRSDKPACDAVEK